jgi:hypothetical protein
MQIYLACLLLICCTQQISALHYETAVCDDNQTAIQMTISSQEFFTVYAKTFAMSDGSTIQGDASDQDSDSPILQKSFRYIHSLMANIGIEATHYSSNDADVKFRICNDQIVQILMFAVIGNFVTNPTDEDLSLQSTTKNLANIVIDVYTGQLIVVNSYNAIRALFLEALLVLCIIIIARISFVKQVKTNQE